MDELQNEHSILVKALKSQYVAEKEAELKNLHDKLSSEKGKGFIARPHKKPWLCMCLYQKKYKGNTTYE